MAAHRTPHRRLSAHSSRYRHLLRRRRCSGITVVASDHRGPKAQPHHGLVAALIAPGSSWEEVRGRRAEALFVTSQWSAAVRAVHSFGVCQDRVVPSSDLAVGVRARGYAGRAILSSLALVAIFAAFTWLTKLNNAQALPELGGILGRREGLQDEGHDI